MNTVDRIALFNRKNYQNPILADYHLFNMHEHADQWGECMGYLFNICAYLYDQDRFDVPNECEYSPGAGGVEIEDPEMFEGCTIEQVEHAGLVLNRYNDRLRAAGLDY